MSGRRRGLRVEIGDCDRVAGTRRVTFEITPDNVLGRLSVDGCEPIELGVTIPACPCIVPDQVEITPAEECDDDGNRAVTFAFPWEITADLDYDDGDSEHFTALSRTHAYVSMDDPCPARTVRLRLPPPLAPSHPQPVTGSLLRGWSRSPARCGAVLLRLLSAHAADLLALFAAAAAGFGAWVAACRPTPCGILTHLTVAISAGRWRWEGKLRGGR